MSGLFGRQMLAVWMKTTSAGSRSASLLIALGVAAALCGPADGAAARMSVPGAFSVSSSGAATYRIPIAVPPGTAGLAPSVSLSYSSDGGDGIVGRGWTLSLGATAGSGHTQAGASGYTQGSGSNTASDEQAGQDSVNAIIRCPRTLAQDSVHGGVNYNSSDRFCLNGQRLVAKSGTYGADGTVYATEIESYSKITSYGTAGNGPSYFIVKTKSGRIIEFGNSTSSKILAVGTSTVRAWAVSKISDTKYNYLTVTYTNDTTNGQFYPTRIDYTGNATASLSPNNSVQFFYNTARPDVVPTYQAGSLQQTTVLLNNIKTYQGSNLVQDYRLDYRLGSSTTHSRLTSVTQCDASSNCLAPTNFTWRGGDSLPTMNSATNGLSTSPSSNLPTVLAGDFNNDGLTDALVADPSACLANFYMGNQNSVFGSYSISHSMKPTGDYSCLPEVGVMNITPIEINGDSLTDFVNYYTQYYDDGNGIIERYFLRKNRNTGGTSFTVDSDQFVGDEYLPIKYRNYADFNGDGLSENSLQHADIYKTNIYSGTPGFTVYGVTAFGDFDGDGCEDALGGKTTARTTFTTYYMCSPAQASIDTSIGLTKLSHVVSGDFNGDGKTDILILPINVTGGMYLSTGTGFVSTGFTPPSSWSGFSIFVGDFNGDGLQDLVLIAPGNYNGQTGMYGAGTAHQIWISTGTGFVQAGTIPNTSDTWSTLVTNYGVKGAYTIADMNNDGASDLWLRKSSGDINYLFAFEPERISAISNGINKTISITYDRLNKNGAFYTKATDAVYPTQDVDGPIYVVKQIDVSNGIGGNSTTTYAYAGYKRDVHGRGALGFTQVTTTNSQTGVITTTNYLTAFPFTGMVSSQTQAANNVTLHSTVNTYVDNSLGNGTDGIARHEINLTRTVVSGADVTGTALPTTTTDYSNYDPYGNPQTVDTSVPDGSNRHSDFTYLHNTAEPWLTSLLTSAVVTDKTADDPTPVMRTSCATYIVDDLSGLMQSEIIEPVSASNCTRSPTSTTGVQTTYEYWPYYGMIRYKTVESSAQRWSQIANNGSGAYVTTCTTAYGYDSRYQFLTSEQNCLNHTVSSTYASASALSFGVPDTRTDQNGLVTSWTYDGFGRPTLEVRPDGNRTSTSYGYCSGVNGGSGDCPANGAYLVTVTPRSISGSQNGAQAIVYADALERSIATDVQGFDGAWIRTDTQFNAYGWVAQVSRPYFRANSTAVWTVNSYIIPSLGVVDPLGRVWSATQPNGRVDRFSYNALTSAVTMDYGGKNQTTTTVKNAQGAIRTVTDADNQTTTYSYSPFNNLWKIVDPAGNTTENIYDVRGNRITSRDRDMGYWAYGYNALGDLISQTDAKNQPSALNWDVLGRLYTATEGAFGRTFTYDSALHGIGFLHISDSTDGTNRTFSYDPLSRPSSSTLVVSGASYTTSTDYYDPSDDMNNGRIKTLTYASGFTPKYLYNQFGYQCQIVDAASTSTDCLGTSLRYWKVNTRDAELHPAEQVFGNGITQTNYYSAYTGLMSGERAGPSDAVASMDYDYDAIGNLTKRADAHTGVFERFCFDPLNRLTQYAYTYGGGDPGAQCAGGTVKTVEYNAIGNIITKSDVGSYAYPASGPNSVRPHAVGSISGMVDGVNNPNYHYDASGNLDCMYTGAYQENCQGGVRKVTYTAFNMTASITQANTSYTYAYDATHNRVKQTEVNGSTTTTTIYVDDLAAGFSAEKIGTIYADCHNPGNDYVWNDYIVAAGVRVGMHTTTWKGSSCTAASPENRYFVLDHLGSTAIIMRDNGSVEQRLSYDAWGKRRLENGSDGKPPTPVTHRGFTSHEHLDDIGLINMNARVYDPTLGRFMAADPVTQDAYDPQSLNRYTYVDNRPLSLTDPTGMIWMNKSNASGAGTQSPTADLPMSEANFLGGGGFVTIVFMSAEARLEYMMMHSDPGGSRGITPNRVSASVTACELGSCSAAHTTTYDRFTRGTNNGGVGNGQVGSDAVVGMGATGGTKLADDLRSLTHSTRDCFGKECTIPMGDKGRTSVVTYGRNGTQFTIHGLAYNMNNQGDGELGFVIMQSVAKFWVVDLADGRVLIDSTFGLTPIVGHDTYIQIRGVPGSGVVPLQFIFEANEGTAEGGGLVTVTRGGK